MIIIWRGGKRWLVMNTLLICVIIELTNRENSAKYMGRGKGANLPDLTARSSDANEDNRKCTMYKDLKSGCCQLRGQDSSLAEDTWNASKSQGLDKGKPAHVP